MKLFLLLSALFVVALAQITCEKYCWGELGAPNCEPLHWEAWRTKPCFARCVRNCQNVGVMTCASRYKCCMHVGGFNNTHKCWPQWYQAW